MRSAYNWVSHRCPEDLMSLLANHYVAFSEVQSGAVQAVHTLVTDPYIAPEHLALLNQAHNPVLLLQEKLHGIIQPIDKITADRTCVDALHAILDTVEHQVRSHAAEGDPRGDVLYQLRN
jgi:hypothetical protein